MNVDSSSRTPTFLCLTLSFVDCHCKGRPDWKLPPVSFIELLILTLYVYSGDEYFLSSIVSIGDLTIEKDVGGFIKDDSCTNAKPLPW